MNYFLLSSTTWKKIMSTISNYWWEVVIDIRAIHWRQWQELTLPKHNGGMGFWDVKHLNIAMLGKQGQQFW
jgi:hypothetical protein